MNDLNIEDSFPTLVTPGKNVSTLNETIEILKNNKPKIEQLLLKNGALLFRDFPVDNADDFAHFIAALNLGEFVNYIMGDSPRDKVKNKIYTSTEAPPSITIPLHQELSYVKHYPKNIYFYCEIEPQFHGETLLADARKIYNRLDKDIIKRFNENKLTYIARYFHKSLLMDLLNRIARSHKSWVEVFETDNKEEIEKICQKNGMAYRWFANDWVELTQTRPASIEHPITKERVWFNQAHLYDFNPRLLGYFRYLGAKILYIRKSYRLHDITFANGDQIPRQDLYHILDVLDQNTVALPLKKNDVMVLDNILAMHGRAPFKKQRRILTALTK